MPANTNPIFVGTPKRPSVRTATANTNRNGSTGTYYTLFTAGANGSFFKGFRACAEVDTGNGAIRLFVQRAGAGNVELTKEWVVPATTFSAGITPLPQIEYFPEDGIMLEAGDVVKVSTHLSEAWGCSLECGGDL